MMRNLAVSLVIWWASAFPAHSQATTKSVTSQSNIPVYFLVDASGSMQGKNQTEAELLLSALSLPQDQLVSVSYFGAKPATPGTDLCFETLVVAPPSRRGENFSPRFPELGGKEDKTAITNAVSFVLKEVAGPAKLIVITDGGEECDRNFSRVRDLHPNAEIEVRQVGNSPNPELQNLESRSPQGHGDSLISPIINLGFRFDTVKKSSNAWATGWYERRLWLFALVGLLISAWLWGASFGKRANFYETAAKNIDKKRLAILKIDNVSEEQMADAIPAELDEEDVISEGKPDAWRSIFAFAIAVILGAPLVLFDFDDATGSYTKVVSWTASVVLPVALLILLLIVIRQVQSVSKGNKKNRLIKSIAEEPVTAALGMIGIGLVIWACWIDVGEAQAASWFVLSASLSGALAISASAPLVFVGSKWWQFEMAKSNYLHTYTEALSSTSREKRRNEKRLKDDWMNFRSQHSVWRPEIEFTLFGRLSTILDGKANSARQTVVEKLRNVAIAAGGESASAEGRKLLEEFLDSRSVATRIRSFLANDVTKDQMVPVDSWDSLAEAIEKKDNRRTAEAYVKLAKSLS